MGDNATERAFETMMEVDALAQKHLATKAGLTVDQFQVGMWQKLSTLGAAKEMQTTGLGEEIAQYGFKTSKGTEIWIAQPIGTTAAGDPVIVGSESINAQRNVDLMFVRYTKAGRKITEVELIGMDNYSTSPDNGGAKHFDRKDQVMKAWEAKFQEKYPNARINVRFDRNESFFWRDKLRELKQLEGELSLVNGDPARLKTLEKQIAGVSEQLEADALKVAQSEAKEVFAPLAKGLLSAARTSATLANIAWKGKELTDIEFKLYTSESLHRLMVAIKDEDPVRIRHAQKLLKEATRPDAQELLTDFVKLAFGTAIGWDAWEAFIDFLTAEWTKAAAEAKQKLKEAAQAEAVDGR
ncbi:hypothetical protein JQ557_14210 [Bradyrhizobium sp. U87765 SZCCT0131]|uniref:hypothetical protein n=1 Tax=unclassified Bradyrhizobium TaxID=2631580 RepID=UPI001BACC67C|nr:MULTISPECIES: hypothetical protein [unclassified Bradyrhizobium]MBR1219154.1 hypothetical protein [Bradyrhizobium sp. U87765 SZCCT0131]MBR1261805.1 hypothetical protein [Bradyrhizobium sp. U87765 SZCCT0134]MBR1306342.1 hypothetical protein [Bradyrhizobium sp. U87765 SZCCT0110]MBR1317587.1 hypothetical protein [Bradyrhizobium sp. U87765 SZCCT0109]MBR1351289.1 hypothetical protein [Bradyrhizobium sp. U87765 SZCCT0048]